MIVIICILYMCYNIIMLYNNIAPTNRICVMIVCALCTPFTVAAIQY